MTGRHSLYGEFLNKFSKLGFEPEIVSATKPQKWFDSEDILL